MQALKHLMPWALTLVVVAAAGCASQTGTVSTFQKRNPQLERDRKELTTQLARSTEELNATKKDLVEVITDIAAIRLTLNDFLDRLTHSEAERQLMTRALKATQYNLEQHTQDRSKIKADLREYFERLADAQRERQTVTQLLKTARDQFENGLTTQDKRMTDLMRRTAELRKRVNWLQNKLDQLDKRDSRR